MLRETLPAIWDELVPRVLPVPSTEKWQTIREGFAEKFDFPNSIGAIDGKHVQMQCRSNAGSDYFSYKGHHSLVLLSSGCSLPVLVDMGTSGRQSDVGVFGESEIEKRLEADTLRVPDVEAPGLPLCLADDEVFLVPKTYLMRPYPGRSL